MQSFSKRLISLRKERGLTQAECAKLNNMQRSTYSGYETEGKEPSFESLCGLANFFGVTTDYLLGISNTRTHNDAVFVNDTKNFAKNYEQLPAAIKQSVIGAFNAFYSILSRDMMPGKKESLDLYTELFSIIEKKRANIRTVTTENTDSNLLFISALMKEQTAFKNEVSDVLDRLMQADLGYAAQKSNKTSSK